MADNISAPASENLSTILSTVDVATILTISDTIPMHNEIMVAINQSLVWSYTRNGRISPVYGNL